MIGINHSPSGISFSAETATSHSSCGVQEQLNLTRAYALKEEQLYSQAFDLFKQLAEKNNAVAQNELGLMYENGLGVSQDFREARACYEIAAKQGSAAAVYNLGVLYQLGLSVSQDFKEALFRYKTAAEMKCVQAFFNMGLLYRYGLGVQPDEEKAQECFDKAVALEDTGFNSLDEFREHLCTKALAWLENKNYTGAFNKFLLLAQTHHPEAQFQLGLMYMKGLGVKQSDTNTVRYLTNADENHHPKAAFMLGESYLARSFLRRDIPQALRWYKKASEAGDGDASYRVAKLLAEADNKKNAQEIRRYLNIANHQGHPTAEQKLAEWENFWKLNRLEKQEQIDLERAYALQKKELYKQAFDLYEQLSIEKKNANAFSNMGHLYCLGLGVPQDYIKAMKCYRSAVEGMNVAALTKMGVLYQVGLGVPQNYDKAMTCYKTAAERGSYEAFFNLGLLYRHGLGVPQNERQAIVCFNNAVAFEVLIEPDGVDEFVQTKLTEALTYLEKEHYAAALTEFLFLVQINHPEALFQIGMMCLKGLGVQQSETNAVKYLIEADENNHPKAALMLGDSYLMNSAPERLNKALTLLEQKKYSTALNQFLLLAQINHPEALFQLGLMYMKGLGVKQSDTNTVKYLTQAHENNHLKAAFMIGESYMRRSIFRRETPQALIWYKKASDAGNGEASYRIAELLIEANDRDYAEKIRHYLHLAISQGQLNAQKKLTKWESQYSWHLSFVDLVVEKEPLGLKGDEMEDEKL